MLTTPDHPNLRTHDHPLISHKLRILRDAETSPQTFRRVLGEIAGDLAKAVERAAAIAQEGDVVLLAPACASFDQFDSFEARGRAFQDAVRALAPAASANRGNA